MIVTTMMITITISHSTLNIIIGSGIGRLDLMNHDIYLENGNGRIVISTLMTRVIRMVPVPRFPFWSELGNISSRGRDFNRTRGSGRRK